MQPTSGHSNPRSQSRHRGDQLSLQHHQEQHQQHDYHDQQLYQGLLDTTQQQPSFLDDYTLWTEDNFGGEGDFDWTTLGLDCFGTQLLQPGPFELGTELQTASLNPLEQQQQPQQEAGMLFGVDDMAISMDGARLAMESEGKLSPSTV